MKKIGNEAKFLFLLLLVAYGWCLCVGCRTSKNHDSQIYERISSGTVAINEICVSTGADSTRTMQRDSVQVEATDSGRVEIVRDTCGDPIIIRWYRFIAVKADEGKDFEAGSAGHACSASKSAATSASVVRESETKTKKQSEAGSTLWLDVITGLMATVLVVMIFAVIYYRTWKK